MQSFISELRRRNVLRVAAFYAAAGWLLVQVATQVFPFFDIANWVIRVVVVAIAPGFPAALALAVVLPLENLSDDKANGYFADGIQDEVLTRLAKVGALKVISRTSTQQYAARPAEPGKP